MKKLIFDLSCISAVVLIFSLGGCSNGPKDVAGTGSGTESAFIAGYIYNLGGAPAANATVRFLTVDYNPGYPGLPKTAAYSAVTDETGRFSLDYLPENVYNVFGEGLNGDVCLQDSVSIGKSPVTLPPDTLKKPGTVRGLSFMAGLNDTNQIRMTLFMPGTGFIRKPDIGGYFSFNNVPEGRYRLIFDPTINEYSVKIMDIQVISDSILDLDTVFIYGTQVTGKPQADAGQDTTVSVNDTIFLHGWSMDAYGMIVRSEWQIGLSAAFRETKSDTSFLAPSTGDSVVYCVLRVTDNSGNVTTDTVKVTVLTDPPVPHAGMDTTVSINDTVRLHGSVTDVFGTIESCAWDIGNTGVFSPSGLDTFFIASNVANNTYRVVLRVIDDDNNTAFDTVMVDISQDAPIADAGADTTFVLHLPATFFGSAFDRYGRIVLYKWDFNGDGLYEDSSSSTGHCTYQYTSTGNFLAVLQVKDDDGNLAYDTVSIRVGHQIIDGVMSAGEWDSFYIGKLTADSNVYFCRFNSWNGIATDFNYKLYMCYDSDWVYIAAEVIVDDSTMSSPSYMMDELKINPGGVGRAVRIWCNNFVTRNPNSPFAPDSNFFGVCDQGRLPKYEAKLSRRTLDPTGEGSFKLSAGFEDYDFYNDEGAFMAVGAKYTGDRSLTGPPNQWDDPQYYPTFQETTRGKFLMIPPP